MDNKQIDSLLSKIARMLDYWHGISYRIPRPYKTFFSRWSIFNTIYNELCPHCKHDWQKIQAFGTKYEKLWDYVSDLAQKLVETECVGNKRGSEPPNKWVKSATLFLRNYFKINPEPICKECTKSKPCQNVLETPEYSKPLPALLTIINQIRNNLVHGDKNEPFNDFERKRNEYLANIGSEILKILLGGLRDSLKSYM